MSPHHDGDVNTGQGTVVEVRPHESERDEPGRRGIPGCVIIEHQVVVNGLGDVNASHVIAGLFGVSIDDVHRVGAVVPANVKEVAHVVDFEDFEDARAILLVGFVPRAQQCR